MLWAVYACSTGIRTAKFWAIPATQVLAQDKDCAYGGLFPRGPVKFVRTKTEPDEKLAKGYRYIGSFDSSLTQFLAGKGAIHERLLESFVTCLVKESVIEGSCDTYVQLLKAAHPGMVIGPSSPVPATDEEMMHLLKPVSLPKPQVPFSRESALWAW